MDFDTKVISWCLGGMVICLTALVILIWKAEAIRLYLLAH